MRKRCKSAGSDSVSTASLAFRFKGSSKVTRSGPVKLKLETSYKKKPTPKSSFKIVLD